LWQKTENGKQVGVRMRLVPRLVKLARVVDGTSNTILYAEKYVRSDSYGSECRSGNGPPGVCRSDDRGWSDGWDGDMMRSTCFAPMSDSDARGWDTTPSTGLERICNDSAVVQGLHNVLLFGSAHPGGINSVFVDGSVRSIPFDVDVVVFNNMGTRNGEEVVH
jgi:prepilin-type processing-associated H-X9-DG protein